MSISSRNIVGSLAAVDLATKSSGLQSSSTQSNNHPKQVIVKHIDQAAAELTTFPVPKTETGNPTVPLTKQSNTVTLVATPKTMSWSIIIVLMTIGIVGMVAVLVYSIVNPGTPK